MRRTLTVFVLVLLAHFAGTPRASSSVPPDYAAPALLTVVLERGDTLLAVSVEPTSYQSVRITSSGGRYRYYGANRIREIRDADGVDRTRDVLERRRTLGTPPADARPEESAWAMRWVAGPRSVTRSFVVAEASLLGRVESGRMAESDHRWYYGFDIGLEEDVAARTAIGWSVFIGSGNGYAALGVRGRFRRWLGEKSSLEVAPGVIIAQDEHESLPGRPPGFTGQVSFSPGPHMTFLADVYTIEKGWEPTVRRETGLLLGLRLGGAPGVAAGAVASLVALGQFASEPRPVYAPKVPGF